MPPAYAARNKYTERVAARYRHESEGRRGSENTILRGLIEEVGVRGLVLDAPCGVGRVIEVAGDRFDRYLGIDLSPAMLGKARERARPAGEGGASRALLRGDLERLPLPDRAADLTLCLRFLHHLPPDIRARVLGELARVTRRVLIVTFFHPFALHFVERKVKDFFRGAANPRFSNTTGWLAGRLSGAGFRLRRETGTGFLRETRYAVFERSGPDV